MITIISPAKNMKVDKEGTKPVSLPYYLEEAKDIWKELKQMMPSDLQVLMKINDKLADDSFDRIQHMKFDMEGTSALETYDGIQYKYMNPQTFTEEAREFAQNHLRVLSGLYGVVRPYDSIYEYRLEMLTKLTVTSSVDGTIAKNLYEFWGRRLHDRLLDEMILGDKEEKGGPGSYDGHNIILNLASDEYGKTIKKYVKEPDRIITCHFKVYSKGQYRVQATAAKMARGSMVRYICENQIDNPEEVKAFDWDGYRFEESLSGPAEYVFLKD
ncbi:MAG: YaaA family protein [Lachnospiraceae bacterium]|nr:YaaA family protein [Lachnospiraceae bacterium]